MTTVDPIADRHAIKTVSFGLERQEPLQEDLLTLFRALHGKVEFHADNLFRKNSRFLPPHAFSLDGLWHSHHGFFDTLNEPTAHQRLNNINVDVLEVSGERVIQTATSHRALLDQAAVNGASLLHSDGSGELDRHMLQLHKANKIFLFELLNDDICRRIDLKAED